jgi:hypothetical protein
MPISTRSKASGLRAFMNSSPPSLSESGSTPRAACARRARRAGRGRRPAEENSGLADNAGLGDRIDVFEVEQFIALNLYELGKFGAEGRRIAVSDFVTRYNEIIEDVETDPSLEIEFKQ